MYQKSKTDRRKDENRPLKIQGNASKLREKYINWSLLLLLKSFCWHLTTFNIQHFAKSSILLRRVNNPWISKIVSLCSNDWFGKAQWFHFALVRVLWTARSTRLRNPSLNLFGRRGPVFTPDSTAESNILMINWVRILGLFSGSRCAFKISSPNSFPQLKQFLISVILYFTILLTSNIATLWRFMLTGSINFDWVIVEKGMQIPMHRFFLCFIVFIVHNNTPIYRLNKRLKWVVLFFIPLMLEDMSEHILPPLICIAKGLFSVSLDKIHLFFLFVL